MNDGRNLSLNWYPVGTGATCLPRTTQTHAWSSRVILIFVGTHPAEGEASDADEGLPEGCRQTMPSIDRIVFSREKEGIPY